MTSERKSYENEIIQQLIEIADEIENEFQKFQFEKCAKSKRRKCNNQSKYPFADCSMINKSIHPTDGEQTIRSINNRVYKPKKLLLVGIGMLCSLVLIKKLIK
ncbi:unnamed protein product [Trichobilharzia szidati]|nr:unnamed protein product [Trichobilharzia szidati]